MSYQRKFTFLIVFLTFASIIVIIVFSSIKDNILSGKTLTNYSNKDLKDLSKQTQSKVNIFTPPQQTNYQFVTGVSKSYYKASEIEDINNENTIVTYENNLGLQSIKPNINNVIIDIISGYAHISDIGSNNCIYPDQLAIQYITKTCQGLRCLDRYGNPIGNGQTIEQLAKRENVPICSNEYLGHLSFNFNLLNDKVTPQTQFMNVEKIFVGSTIRANIEANPNLEYYVENELFVLKTGLSPSQIIPYITHKRYEESSFNQKIVISRYKGGTSFTPSATGNLAEIIFRPGDLFLNAQTATDSIINIIIGSNAVSQFVNTGFVRSVKQGTNAKALSIYNGVSFKIINGGNNYDNSSAVSIEGDDGNFYGNFGISTRSVEKQIIFDERSGQAARQRAVWLITPPTNLSPEKITKDNKANQGFVQNYSSEGTLDNMKKSNVPAFNQVSPGRIIMGINISEIPSIKLSSLYNVSSVDAAIQSKGENTTEIIYQNIDGTTTTIKAKIGDDKISEFTDKQRRYVAYTEADIPNLYNQYPPNLYKAVNMLPGTASSKVIATTPSSAGAYQSFVATSTILGLNTGYSAGCWVEPHTGSALSSAGDIILDGDVEWETIDTFTETYAFRKEYFTSPGLKDGMSIVTKLDETTGLSQPYNNFKDAIYGKIDKIDATGIVYTDINITKSDPQIIQMGSSTMVAIKDGASVGSDAVGLVTFRNSGTSVFVNDITLVDGGKNFKSGVFGICAAAIGVSTGGFLDNINIKSSNQEFLFEAVGMSGTKPYKFQSDGDVPVDLSYGLIIDPYNDKGEVVTTTPTIVKGGQGYEVNQKVYINQLDSNLDSIYGVSWNNDNISQANMEKLPYVIVRGTSSIPKDFYPAYEPLMKEEENIVYNFWEDSPGIYSDCPQQFVYYGDFLNKYGASGASLNPYIGTPEEGLAKFFLANKIGENTPYTDVEFLTSLQIPSFYYEKKSIIPLIENNEGLQLKRFIPFRQFQPPSIQSDDTGGIPTGTDGTCYTNYNYCQFIPYGTKNLYDREFSAYNKIGSL